MKASTWLLPGACGLAVLTAGCTGERYQRWADREVNDLLEDRRAEVLDYQPQVEAKVTTDAEPDPVAFRRVPVTRVPQEITPTLEPARYELTFAPYGPSPLEDDVDPDIGPTGIGLLDDLNIEELRLGPPARLQELVSLDLFGSINFAVRNSRTYQSEMEQLYLAALSVTLERDAFEPGPFASIGSVVRHTDGFGNYQTALDVVGRAGVAQRLPYGGEVVASALVNVVESLNNNVVEGESAELALTATIPLLQGAGIVNLEPLIQAERNLVYATRDFEAFRRSFAVQVSTQYFNIVTAQRSLQNRYRNYLSFVDLTERTQALFAAGNLTALQVQRSVQSLLNAEDALNDAQRTLEDQLDRYKLLLGMPIRTELEVVPVEVVIERADVDDPNVVPLALTYRLDLQTARDQVADARRRVNVAKNGLLPDLDVILDARVGSEPGESLLDIDRRTGDYSAGFSLDIPLDQLPERNRYRAALITLERENRGVQLLEDQVAVDVRAAVRAIRSAELTLELQRRGIELARQRLDFANESLLLGRTTDSRDVVEAQNDLLDAQDRFERARASLQVQILEFLRDTGTLRVDPASGTLGLAMDRRLDFVLNIPEPDLLP
ncbi:MAG: TolC family protein [Phycisphaerae bacterium]